MKLSGHQYEQIVNRAEKAGACEPAISLLRRMTPDEALCHELALYWLFWYACFVIKARWPEAEEVIRQDAEWAYCYAYDVIKGRWPEAEEVIRQDAEWAYCYARDVIKARWPDKKGG